MKILLSAYACEPNRGSELGNGWSWAYYLAEAGHTVHLLTRPHGRNAIENELVHRPHLDLRVHYVDVPKWSKCYMQGQFGVYAYYFLWQRVALKVAIELKADVELVHHVTWGSLHGGSYLWKLGLPFIFGPIGGGQVAPSAFKEVFGRREWCKESMRTLLTKTLPYNPALRRMFTHTDLVLATNKETLIMAKRMGARRVELSLDTGLSESFFPAEFPKRKPTGELKVLWVGRIYARKSLPLAFLAIRKAVDLSVPVRLTVVGDGPLGTKVPEWIRMYGLEGRVDWWGQVSWTKVREAYASNDVFLFTSLRDSFGSQLLEAMAFGLPILTLNHHGARDFVPEAAGMKVPVYTLENTTDHLAMCLKYLWTNLDKRLLMGRAGYDFARTQLWSRRIEAISTLYKAILG